MLLAASAVTYGLIALATPITYTFIAADRFEQRAAALPARLEQTTLEDCGPVIDQFVVDTGARVVITDEEGTAIQTPSALADISVTYTDFSVFVISNNEGRGGQEGTAGAGGAFSGSETDIVTVTTDSLSYPFSFQGDFTVYTVSVSPPVRGENQALEALGRVGPWLLAGMLLFSVLCALFYSRCVTRPIVRLSGISQRMAELDFTWKCAEARTDEIGVLGRNLDELSRRLSAALAGLEDANAALRRDIDRERELERQRLAFFSAASHELKTPVTILKGQLTGMLEGVGIYRDRDQYLAKALRVIGRMEGLVREILTVSRMEAGGFALNLRQTDLTELVRGQLSLYEELIQRKGLRTELRLAAHAPFTGDPALLQKALDNVLSNAVFYAPEGAALSVSLTSGGETGPVLTVENGGAQIPEDALPHVFEPFYRADASRDRRTGGSGLGLYIVKMILDRHGAEYGIENTTDGVRFTICFAREQGCTFRAEGGIMGSAAN